MVVRFSGIVVTARALECKSRASQPSRVFCTRTHPAPTTCEPLHGNTCPPSSAMGGREAHHDARAAQGPRRGRSGKKERRTFVGGRWFGAKLVPNIYPGKKERCKRSILTWQGNAAAQSRRKQAVYSCFGTKPGKVIIILESNLECKLPHLGMSQGKVVIICHRNVNWPL